MNPATFIPKDNYELPDVYGITIFHHSGRKEEIEVASHKILDVMRVYCSNGDFSDQDGQRFRLEPSTSPCFEYVTKDDLWTLVPMSSIEKVSFDKRWSKIIASRSTKK